MGINRIAVPVRLIVYEYADDVLSKKSHCTRVFELLCSALNAKTYFLFNIGICRELHFIVFGAKF